MNMLSKTNGGSRLSVFLFFLVAFAVIHVGVKIVPMYMAYSRMQDEMTVKAGVAQVLKDEEIMKDLVTKARELDLPLTEESFILKRDEERRRMKITTKGGWDVEQVFFWGAYRHTFHFEPAVEESFMSITR